MHFDDLPNLVNQDRLYELQQGAKACTSCSLCQARKHVIFGEGAPTARLMIVGEAPSEQDDLEGRPFVGPAGQVLDRWLAKIRIPRQVCYATTVVKCRTPDGCEPEPGETGACAWWLHEQIMVIKPKAILALGDVALRCLCDSSADRVRQVGKWHTYQHHPIPVMPMPDPADVLRHDEDAIEAAVFECLQAVRGELDATPL